MHTVNEVMYMLTYCDKFLLHVCFVLHLILGFPLIFETSVYFPNRSKGTIDCCATE